MNLILFVVLLLATIASFAWFRLQTPRDKLWWLGTWTSHALLFALIDSGFNLIDKKLAFWDIVAGSTLFFTGIGFEIIFFLYWIENRRFLFSWSINLVSILGHAILTCWGFILLLFTNVDDWKIIIFASLFLFIYSLIVTTFGIDRKFILYRESRTPEILRLWLIRLGTIVMLTLLPFLALG